MHAASVHPEPGSNSLKFVYYPLLRLTSLPERFGSLLVRVSLNSKEFSESSFFVYQKKVRLVVQFSKSFALSSRQLVYYITLSFLCQALF